MFIPKNNKSKYYQVVFTIGQAFRNLELSAGLKFLSEHGSQHISKEVMKILKENQCDQRMSSKGNCYYNSVAESFFRRIKVELIYSKKNLTRQSDVIIILNILKCLQPREGTRNIKLLFTT